MQIRIFNAGALIWIPSHTKRWLDNDGDQLKIFPHTLSVTKRPMLGIFKCYNFNGNAEVLCPDGIWSFEKDDLKPYVKKEFVC